MRRCNQQICHQTATKVQLIAYLKATPFSRNRKGYPNILGTKKSIDPSADPSCPFRRIQLEAGEALQACGRLSDLARLAWRILRRARAVEQWHLDRDTVLMQPAAADPLVAANEDWVRIDLRWFEYL